MRIYLSSFTEQALFEYVKIFPSSKLNILISYGLRNASYKTFIENNERNINSLILDSGTYTLNFAKDLALRQKINFSGFCAFIEQFENSFDYIFNFDKYFDDNGMMRNMYYQEKLEELGYKNIVPVVHNYSGEDLDYLIHKGYKLIALGYSKEKNQKNIVKLANKAYSNKVKVHVLGVSSYKKLANAPIAYCDSSSWVHYSLNGVLNYWNPKKDSSDKTDSLHFAHDGTRNPNWKGYYYSDYLYLEDLKKYLDETFGYDYHDLLDPKSIKRQIVNIRYFVELQERITKKQTDLGYLY